MWQKTIGLDGEIYDSKSEANVADWLRVNDIEYVPHKRLPKPSRSICDFYLPEYDLWVEYDGLMKVRADNKLEKKKAFYEKRGLKFLIITRDNWQRDLLERIELGG
jgi:very-short-patch-repair endonuclease